MLSCVECAVSVSRDCACADQVPIENCECSLTNVISLSRYTQNSLLLSTRGRAQEKEPHNTRTPLERAPCMVVALPLALHGRWRVFRVGYKYRIKQRRAAPGEFDELNTKTRSSQVVISPSYTYIVCRSVGGAFGGP